MLMFIKLRKKHNSKNLFSGLYSFKTAFALLRVLHRVLELKAVSEKQNQPAFFFFVCVNNFFFVHSLFWHTFEFCFFKKIKIDDKLLFGCTRNQRVRVYECFIEIKWWWWGRCTSFPLWQSGRQRAHRHSWNIFFFLFLYNFDYSSVNFIHANSFI